MKKLILCLTVFGFTISKGFSQSLTLTPEQAQLSTSYSKLVIGDNLPGLSAAIPFLVNRPTKDSVNYSIVGAKMSSLIGVNATNTKSQYNFEINSSVNPTQFNFLTNNGRVSINNEGGILLGGSFDGDISSILLDIKSKQPGNIITASGVGISAAQRIFHTHKNTAFSELHGFYAHTDSAGNVNSSVFAESGESGSIVNIGVFGRVYKSPVSGSKGIAIVGVDAINASNTFAAEFQGKVDVIGTLSKSSGTFKIDHPQDRYNKYLYHSFVESPDMMNIYNGNITTGRDSIAIVTLPGYFESLNIDFRYQLTVMREFAQAIVWEPINENTFIIKTDKPNVQVSWQVTGIRNDIYAQDHRIIPEVTKPKSEQGKLLYERPPVEGLGVSPKNKILTSYPY